MDQYNLFDRNFNQLTDSYQLKEEIRMRLAEGLNELNEVKRKTTNKQSCYAVLDGDIQDIKIVNQKLRESMIAKLIEKDESFIRKKALIMHIEQLNQQLENADKESNLMLNDDSIEQICQRYSTLNQLSVLNKIQEAKCKLIKFQN